MKKYLAILLLVMLSSTVIYAQDTATSAPPVKLPAPPHAFSLKATISGNSGQPLINKNVNLRISILQNSTTGAVVYSEIFNTRTNSSSQVDIRIGEGTPVTGSFSTIPWTTDVFFMALEVDNRCFAISPIELPALPAVFTCGSSFTINHVAGSVAPVTKTVTYGTVTNIPGEPTKCWITQNLGADHQARAVNDTTEASAGWYWQFSSKQGHKPTGTSITPLLDLTSQIFADSIWASINDPCTIELGNGWRIPTYIEWTNVNAAGNWVPWEGPFSSGLKLHSAGSLSYSDGKLDSRGKFGYFWASKEVSHYNGESFYFYKDGSYLSYFGKSYGMSLRCVKDAGSQVSFPTVTTSAMKKTDEQTLICGGNITNDGGSTVTARGICWSTVPNPTLADNHTKDGNGTGPFVSSLTGLVQNTLYYIRSYATNSAGTGYGNEVSFTNLPAVFTCGSAFTIKHVAGSVAPVTKTVTYGTTREKDIPGEQLRCWITSNLGADYQANAVGDSSEASAGWYWQFGRKQGYKHDGSNRTPNTAWISSIEQTWDWNIANDPCVLELGNGWRIPTGREWDHLYEYQHWFGWTDLYNSNFKLHAAGYLQISDGSLANRGMTGRYLGKPDYVGTLFLSKNGYSVDYSAFPYGYSVRCTKNESRESIPTVITDPRINASLTFASVGGNVTDNGGVNIMVQGVCWSTSPTPTTSNNVIKSYVENGSSSFACKIIDLIPGTLYYIRAFATNNAGTAYGNEVSFTTLPVSPFVVCGDFITVNHVAGSISPVTKTVTYGTVSNISGEPSKCWITQNLGADHQASNLDDITEASAGWYWQFNRKQGYKHDGTTRTPNTSWIINIDENSDWSSTNDPCTLELGSGWRIPTSTEWTNVYSGGKWTTRLGTWNSDLKLHAGGHIDNTGSLVHRAWGGIFWSQTVYNGNALVMITENPISVAFRSKDYGFSLRCIKE